MPGQSAQERGGQFRGHQWQEPWPSAGNFVAAYGQVFMAADIGVNLGLSTLGRYHHR